jgi:branched-subunit amino acid ABC-type transport system permease component
MAAYILHLAILAGIYVILALSLNLIVGYAGQVSLGHAAFYGIGAYISTLTALNWHFPYLLAALAAMVFAGLCGLALGLPTLRLKEDYLAIVTLGFGVIIDRRSRWHCGHSLPRDTGVQFPPAHPVFSAGLPGGGLHAVVHLSPGQLLSRAGPAGHPGS